MTSATFNFSQTMDTTSFSVAQDVFSFTGPAGNLDPVHHRLPMGDQPATPHRLRGAKHRGQLPLGTQPNNTLVERFHSTTTRTERPARSRATALRTTTRSGLRAAARPTCLATALPRAVQPGAEPRAGRAGVTTLTATELCGRHDHHGQLGGEHVNYYGTTFTSVTVEFQRQHSVRRGEHGVHHDRIATYAAGGVLCRLLGRPDHQPEHGDRRPGAYGVSGRHRRRAAGSHRQLAERRTTSPARPATTTALRSQLCCRLNTGTTAGSMISNFSTSTSRGPQRIRAASVPRWAFTGPGAILLLATRWSPRSTAATPPWSGATRRVRFFKTRPRCQRQRTVQRGLRPDYSSCRAPVRSTRKATPGPHVYLGSGWRRHLGESGAGRPRATKTSPTRYSTRPAWGTALYSAVGTFDPSGAASEAQPR